MAILYHQVPNPLSHDSHIFHRCKVTEEFEYVYETLTQRVLALPDSDALVDTFDCYQYKGCMQRLAAAFKNIKFPEGMVQLESIVARVLEREPISWQAQLDAMDTIIFFLNYAGAERLDLAFQQFRLLNGGRPRVQEALATIEKTYPAPVVAVEDPLGMEAQLAALKAPLPADASDW
jgi:hypothetical protein